jgi:hypothetical protein
MSLLVRVFKAAIVEVVTAVRNYRPLARENS